MAMRWPSYSAAALLLGAACVTVTQRSYFPDLAAGRLAPDDFRARAGALLAAECPRLLGSSRSALGETGFTVVLTGSGAVREAILDKRSGDERIDDVFGALVAQLQVVMTSGGDDSRAPIVVGYSCSPEHSLVTLDLDPEP